MNNVNEKDWKLYRSRRAKWQEDCMEKLLEEYRKIIDMDAAPSERFWKLNDRIKDDKKLKGVLIESRRSLLVSNLASLLMEGTITLDDLDGFSEELIEQVKMMAEV